MNKNQLLKKGIAITVIVILIGLAFTSASLSERDISIQNISSNNTELSLSSDDDTILEYDTSTRNMNANKLGLNLQLGGWINIEADEDALSEPIEPLSGYRLVPVNVSYRLYGILADELLPVIKKRWPCMPIYLSINRTSEWADAIIIPDIVYPEISTEFKSDTTNLFISIVNKSAFAFTGGLIVIEAKTKPLLGPFGIITWVNPTQITSAPHFVPDYFPLISVTLENDTIETPPGQVVELQITIKNIGNAKTRITFDKLEYPDDWTVEIVPSILIDIFENQEKQVPLVLRSPQNFIGNQTIRLALTPRYYQNPENYNRGITDFISILAYYQP